LQLTINNAFHLCYYRNMVNKQKQKDIKNEIIKDLNSEQEKAVSYHDGPLLIIAGAGTGKTTVITRRIAWLILNNLAKTEEVLALTFTDKAAQEMEERIDRLLPYGYVDLWVSTFHSFCERILRQHALDIGLPLSFKILNESQQCFLVQENLSKFDLDYYRPLGNPTKFVQSLVKHFSRAKDELISPEEYLDYVENLKMDQDTTMSDESLNQEASRVKEVANAYHFYQRLLLENNALDFGDLINYTLKIFQTRPQILEKYQKQFKYILVDEFQDTNWAQYKLLQLLAQPKNNLTVVSDDDQSIYKFRGASYNNVIQFRKDYPSSNQVVLIKNYRSQQDILDLAYNFIQLNNPARLEAQEEKINKKLLAEKGEKGEISHLHFKNQYDEARGVIKKIIELKKNDTESTWNDFAILIRANSQADNFIQLLSESGIPHQFLARRGLFSKPVIMDILSYLKLLDNYHESPAVYRILISPLFFQKITNQELINFNNFANKKAWSLYEAMQKSSLIPGISDKTKESFNILLSWVEKHSELAQKESVGKVVFSFLEDSGYLKILTKDKEETEKDNRESIFWLNQFFKKVENFEAINFDKTVKNFIQMVDLMVATGDTGSMEAENEEGPEAVKVSTIHSAKGLEFKYVFIVNLVDKRFPTIERHEAIELPEKLIKEIRPEGDIHLQEERRLFYVALTRAKNGLYLTSADDYGGKTVKKLSRFLYELGMEEKQETSKEKKSNFNFISSIPVASNILKTNKSVLPLRFSFSQLIAFESCPLQYKFSFILKIPRRGRHVFSFGKTLHSTLYQFCQIWRKQQSTLQKTLFSQQGHQTKEDSKLKEQIGFEKLMKIYQESWIDEWYQSREQKEKYWEKGKKALKTFYQDLNTTQPKIKYLEKGFNFKIGKGKDKEIMKGFIDRVDEVDGGYEIIDYKTGEEGERRLDFEKKQQLLIYQFAAKELYEAFDKPVNQLTFYYLETGNRVSFLGKDDDLIKLEEKIIKIIQDIKKDDFPPKPGPLCKFCDFYHICQYRQE